MRGEAGMEARPWCPGCAGRGARGTAETRPRVRTYSAGGGAAAGGVLGLGRGAAGGGPSPVPSPLPWRFLGDPAGVGAWLAASAVPVEPGVAPAGAGRRTGAEAALAALKLCSTCPGGAHMLGCVTASQLCAP